jgi:Destabilase
MNRMTSLVCVGVCALVCARAWAGAPARADARLLDALRQVESHGNDRAVGDNGKAIGPYQIWYSYWKDAVEFDKTLGGSYEDCYKPDYARRVVIAYLSRYAPKNASYEQLARIHNGGPKGDKNNKTIKYWNKVKKEL